MFKFIAFCAGGRSGVFQFSNVLTPVLGRTKASFSIPLCRPAKKVELLTGLKWNTFKILSVPNSTEASNKIKLNREQKESVPEQLKLYDESLSLRSKVFLLSWVGRTVDQKVQELDNQESSALVRLLNCIADGISQLQHRELAVVAWSLAKMKARNHPLIKACENEIISRGLGTFDHRSISQIAWGFSRLDIKNSNIFEEIEKAIISKQLTLAIFDVRGLAQTLVAFVVTNNGSPKLLQIFAEEILSHDFAVFRNKDLVQIVWSFAKRNVKANQLFDKTEAELFRRGVSNINREGEIALLLWSFASAEQKKDDLFRALESQILSLRNLSGFTDRHLKDTIWALEKFGGMACIKKLKLEAERRGIESDVTKEKV